jgi:hypothetical protein
MIPTFGWFATALLMLFFVANAVFMLISPDAYRRIFPDWRFQKSGQHTSGPLAVSKALTTRIRGSLLLAVTLWSLYLILHRIR